MDTAKEFRPVRRAAFPFLKNSNQNNLAKLKDTKKSGSENRTALILLVLFD